MLQQMREQARGIFGWIIIGAIVLVLSVFGFGALSFFAPSEPVIAQVGDAEILQAEFEGRVEQQRRQLLAQFGPDVDPSVIDEDLLRTRVLSSMIERTLLLEGARRTGMGAPEPSLDDVIIQTPEFQVDGRFDQDRFRLVLASAGMTPIMYRRALGDDLVVNQLSAGIGDSGFITESDLSAMAQLTGQERDLAWLSFTPSDYEGEIEVEDAEVREYYDANSDLYRAPEQVTVQYLRLDRAELAAGQEVSEEAVQEAYAAEAAAFEGQERRRSAHILLSLEDDRDEATAVALAEELRERLLAGESFETLAEEFSDDPGSASRGGDLGFAVRGTFVPPFEQALFAMEEGDISAPVVSQFGVHLIRLDEVAVTEAPSLARLRATLEQRIRERAAQERFDEDLAQLQTLAYEAPDLAEPAEALGLEIMTAGPFARNTGEGEFAIPAVVDAAFSDDVLSGGFNSDVLEPDDGVALVLRVTDNAPARLRDFEEVVEAARADLIAELALNRASDDARRVMERLNAGASVSAVAAEFGREWTRREGVRRDDREAPQAVVRQVFSLPQPAAGARSLGTAELPAGGLAVVALTSVRPGDLAALTELERDQLERALQARQGSAEFEAFRDALRRDIGVTRRVTADLES